MKTYSTSKISLICKFLSFFFFKILFILDRGEGREIERERNSNVWLSLSHTPPTLETWPITQACALDWKSNQQPFGLQANTQSTEPHQPEFPSFLKLSPTDLERFAFFFLWSLPLRIQSHTLLPVLLLRFLETSVPFSLVSQTTVLIQASTSLIQFMLPASQSSSQHTLGIRIQSRLCVPNLQKHLVKGD